jgi:hypothetical protein
MATRFVVSHMQKYKFNESCEVSSVFIVTPHFVIVHYVALVFSNSDVCTEAVAV